MTETRPRPDDRRLPLVRILPLFAATAVSVSVAAGSVPNESGAGLPGVGVGLLVAAMAIFGLHSIPARWASRGVVLLGGGLMVRYGELGTETGLPSGRVLLWAAATVAAFVLGGRLESAVVPEAPTGRRPTGRTVARTALAVVAVAALASAAALSFGSDAARAFGLPSSNGDRADLRDSGPSNPMLSPSSVDTTSRPRLSDRLVMTVRADRPSFWRTATFDDWDGRRWTRSEPSAVLIPTGRLSHEPDDLSAVDGEELVQRIRIESRYAEVLPAAPSPVEVDSRSVLFQWADGSLVAAGGAVGSGTTYTVTSRQIPVTVDAMRAASRDDIPAEVLDRYASPPRTTERVRDLAAELTAGLDDDYDKVVAIEAYMGETTEYSLDAPLAPTGVDVVDDFLFESKLGWCEQIASALTVLLRESGVPARVATGFVPGEWDPVGRQYQVREQDAHMWTEVWFAGLGWVPFDPTAEVPSAGSAAAGDEAAWWWRQAERLLLALAVVAVAVEPLLRLVQWLFRRRSRRARREGRGSRVSDAPPWLVAAVARIEQAGARAGRPRAPDESVARYTADLAQRWGDPWLAELGVRIDEASYGPAGPDVLRERIDALLAASPLGEVPEPVPVS